MVRFRFVLKESTLLGGFQSRAGLELTTISGGPRHFRLEIGPIGVRLLGIASVEGVLPRVFDSG